MKDSIVARIEKGTGRISINSAILKRFIERNQGKWVDIIPRNPKRSLTQNAYYWVYLNVISEETGNDIDDLHEFFKHKYLPFKTITIKGKKGEHTFKRITSTSELSKNDFGEYLDKICAATGIPLPDPQAAGYLPR